MKILIFKEDHGKRYFDASTPELIDKACIKVLKERLKYGYYDTCNEPIDTSLSMDEINKLPAEYKNAEMGKKKAYEKRYTQYKKDLKFKEAVEKITQNPDSEKLGFAYSLISHRSDYGYEYEMIDIIKLESVD